MFAVILVSPKYFSETSGPFTLIIKFLAITSILKAHDFFKRPTLPEAYNKSCHWDRSVKFQQTVIKMPQSPVTPTRRRRSSGFSINTGRPSHSRKSSFQSLHSPVTPHASSGLDRSGEFGLAGGTISEGTATNGLESLAAELAEEDWEEEEYDDGLVEGEDSCPTAGPDESQDSEKLQFNGTRRVPLDKTTNGTSPPNSRKSRHRKALSGTSDLSEVTDIDESEVMSPQLESHISTIETLYKQDLHEGKYADTFNRIKAELRDLGSQASVESHTTRCVPQHSTYYASYQSGLYPCIHTNGDLDLPTQ